MNPSKNRLRIKNQVNPEDYKWICKFLEEESAIYLEQGKEYLVSSRMTPLIRRHGFVDIDELISAVKANPVSALAGEVVDAMTTNETSFFRDIHPFESLRDDVLPEIIKTRGDTKRLRIWSGACSSGQEPLSIAMVIRENFPDMQDWDIKIIGTDLSRSILAKAETSEYSQLEINRGLPPQLTSRYFDRSGSKFIAKPTITDIVSYQHLNLAKTWTGLPTFDIIFLRNVLIYFENHTKTHILDQVRSHITDDGWLALGGAETTRGVENPSFTRHLINRTVWYRAD